MTEAEKRIVELAIKEAHDNSASERMTELARGVCRERADMDALRAADERYSEVVPDLRASKRMLRFIEGGVYHWESEDVAAARKLHGDMKNAVKFFQVLLAGDGS